MSELTSAEISRLSKPGTYRVADCLYLRIIGQSRTWSLRWTRHGKTRTKSLGPIELLPLARAKDAALAMRVNIRQGGAPDMRSGPATFAEVAKLALPELTVGKCASVQREWETSLLRVADFGKAHIGEIRQDDITRLLKQFWVSNPEKAQRLKARLFRVFEWARAAGYSTAENPANRDGIKARLGPIKIARGQFESLAPEDAPSFYKELCSHGTSQALALQTVMLTACRANEVRLASWKEVDLSERLIRLPAMRTKQRREHIVPLSSLAHKVLMAVGPKPAGHVFGGLEVSAMLRLLRKITGGKETVHGLRSTFATWAENQETPDRLIELSLAHLDKDKVRAAYRRDPQIEKRRALLERWAAYLAA